jgi:hypothetical protein
VTTARAAARAAEAIDASDVGPELVRDLSNRFPLWHEATTLDTARAPGRAADDALALLRTHRCDGSHEIVN